MKQDSINYTMVGAFVIAMFSVLFFSLLRLSNHQGQTDTYYVLYDNITGIQPGSLVTFGGYRIGQVDDIEAVQSQGKTQFRLQLALKRNWRIPADSTARIVSPGLLSDPQINIEEGKSNRPHSPGDTLSGQGAVNMFAALDAVAHELQDLSDNSVQPLIDNLNGQFTTLAERIDKLGVNLDQAVPNVLASAEKLLVELNHGAAQFNRLVNTENQQQLRGILSNANQFSGRFLELSGNIESALQALNLLLQDSRLVVDNNDSDIRQAVAELRKSLKTISTSVDSVMYNLDETSRNFNEFSRKVRTNPSLLISSPVPAIQEEKPR